MNQKSPERDSKELPDSAIDGSYKESSENAPHLRSSKFQSLTIVTYKFELMLDPNFEDGVHRPPVNGSIESVTASSMDEESSGGPKNNLIGEVKVEKWWQLLAQVSIPFLIAGCGTIGAGVILGQVKVSSSKATGWTFSLFAKIFRHGKSLRASQSCSSSCQL